MLTMISSGGRQHRLAPWMLFGGVLTAGCAPIQSKPLDGKTNVEGLVYYLPKRDIVVTLTRPKDAPVTLSASSGTAYADLSKRYLLTTKGTPAGERTLDVGISEAGLLQSANAQLVSEVGAIAAAIASSAGGLPFRSARSRQTQSCTQLAAYSIAIDGSNAVENFCGFRIEVAAIPFSIQPTAAPGGGNAATDGQVAEPTPVGVSAYDVVPAPSGAGYYYRQARPYRVRVCPYKSGSKNCASREMVLDVVLNSPTGAPIHFIPVSKALFADNDSQVTFSDGMLTQYKEVKGSELLGLTSIPADVIAAYFKAAGGLFDFLEDKNTSDVEQVNGQLALKLAKMRYDACLVAINNKDEPAIKSLGCNGGD